MEAAASVASASRAVSMPMLSSHPLRKEWRAVPEHSVRNAGTEDLERSKFGQVDERTIYEVQQERESAGNVDFCAVTVNNNGGLGNDIVQQRLHSVVRQREELQQMEVELRAQVIARSEIMEMKSAFDAQIKEHANANLKIQGQLNEREQTIRELERKMEETEREFHAIKLDTEAAWAKEDLLREQNKELATFRRERDNSEAERVQHLKQIHDLQDHFQDKERQFMELQEQHRIAQETIIFKDEQLREAQGWIRRVQEMDGLQSTSLQAELRERTEQYNQLWLGCQRQFADMERLHVHTIQQLQIELADARERSGAYPDESRVSQPNLKDVSHIVQNNGIQVDVNGSSTTSGNHGVVQNGNAENVSSYATNGNDYTQTEHVPGVALAPSSILGMPSYLPPGQMTALHPFVLHQQGGPYSVPSHVAQSHVGQFHTVPGTSPLQHWQVQQGVSEGIQMSSNSQYPQSHTDQNLLRSDNNHNHEGSINGKALHPGYSNVHVNQAVESDSTIPSSAEERQVREPTDNSYVVGPQPPQSLHQISSQCHDTLRTEPLAQNCETKEEEGIVAFTNHGLVSQGLTTEQTSSAVNAPLSETSAAPANISVTTMNQSSGAILPEAFVSSGQKNTHAVGKTVEITLLDERSLLVCIVRTIPPAGSGGRIRISSTLPNRLGKMLAPLHWHDYKKKYGKLDDFLASHPELFVIDGDFIQLREGAQETIAATAAVAKVPAATSSSSSPYSSLLPSVAVTPVAQSHHRLKRAPSTDSNSDSASQLLTMQKQHLNGVCLNVAGGTSNVKILSKPKNSVEINGPEIRRGQSSGPTTVGTGANSTQGRAGANVVGKQLVRMTVVTSASRK